MITTGHMTVGAIAERVVSPRSRASADDLLGRELDFPAVTAREPKYGNVPPRELAERLDTLLLTAVWPDAIKNYAWAEDGLDGVYSNLHYMNTAVAIGARYTSDEIDEMVVAERAGPYAVNTINGVNSAVTTLLAHVADPDSIAEQEAIVALRVLVHYLGDIAQPYHMCDPTFLDDDGRQHSTNGGNGMLIADGSGRTPVSFPVFAPGRQPPPSSPAPEFHLFWDACCGIVPQAPEPYNADFDEWGQGSWFGDDHLGDGHEAAYVQYIEAIARHVLGEFGERFDSAAPQSATAWAQQSARLAVEFLDLERFDISVQPGVDDKGKVKVLFRDLERYVAAARPALGAQLATAGLRLGGLIDAIFHPASAGENMVEMVEHIRGQDLPTLATLARSAEHPPTALRRRCRSA